jgi:hypothetical protein
MFLRVGRGTALAPLAGGNMLRTTSMLIVMLLAAGSTSPLACELWCDSPAAGSHHAAIGCHDASTGSPGEQQITSITGCHDAAGVAPFVMAIRQTESLCNTITPTAVVQFGSIGADQDGVAAGRWIFSPQPLRPASFGAVLRI